MAELIMTEEASTPSTPSSNKWKFYFKSDGIYYLDDTGAEIGPITTPVITWNPTPTNLTIGNGVVTGRYARAGKIVVIQYRLTLGTTSSVSGNVSFPLPVASAGSLGASAPIGITRFKDASGSAYSGILQLQTNDLLLPMVLDTSGTYAGVAQMAAAVPFSWTSTDDFEFTGYYLT